MQPYYTLTFTQFQPAGSIALWVLHDATVFGPWADEYWLINNWTMWTNDSNQLGFSAWIVEPGALQNLKNFISNLGGGYQPNWYGNPPTTLPLPGIHKIGPCDGQGNIADWTSMSASTFASVQFSFGAASMANSMGRRAIALPSGWSCYMTVQGSIIPNCQMHMVLGYQRYKNGCRPDAFASRLPFRGANFNDLSGVIAPVAS